MTALTEDCLTCMGEGSGAPMHLEQKQPFDQATRSRTAFIE
jgi:hypothetical protein